MMIELKNVLKWCQDFKVLHDCSVKLEKGEVVILCGPSCSGKSTLIKLINGLESFEKGDIFFHGWSIKAPGVKLPELRRRIGMVFQHFDLFPHLTVLKNLIIAQIKVLKRSRADAEVRALSLLDRVGLAVHARKHPSQLSAANNNGLPLPVRCP